MPPPAARTAIPPDHPAAVSRRVRAMGPVGLVVLTIGSVIALASLGLPEGVSPFIAVVSAVLTLVESCYLPLAYMLGAMGLGRLCVWVLARGSRRDEGFGTSAQGIAAVGSRHALQLALGLALMLFVTHLLGITGLLSGSGTRPLIAAWAPVAIGLALLIDQVIRGSLRPETWPVIPRSAMVMAPALGVMLTAAASAPGWLWESEFGGYDVLSYHLQLPKEWITREPEGVGRLWPVEHNVYSFLPSYFEGAYLHLGSMIPGAGEGGGARPLGLESEKLIWDEGTWLYSCQLLHTLCAVSLAFIVARLTRALIEVWHGQFAARDGGREHWPISGTPPLLAAAVCLATPWTIVTGSIAYNEMPMLALFAGALLAAVEPGLRPWARGLAAGLLVGAACSVKPTALFMCAPVVALALAIFTKPWVARRSAAAPDAFPLREWFMIALVGSIAGIAVMAPWLVRNYLACGNPVFPFAAATLGMGHWSAEALATFSRNHHAQEPVLERLALLFTERGAMHAQWALLPMLGAIAAGALALRPATRRIGAWLGGSIVIQVLAWVLFTHVQSRFLMSVLVPCAVAVGMGAHTLFSIGYSPGAARTGSLPRLRFGLVAIPLLLSAWSVVIFLGQHHHQPNRMIVTGAMLLSGVAHEQAYYTLPPAERPPYLAGMQSVAPFVNLAVQPEMLADPSGGEPSYGRVYLLGDATALYFLGATGGPRAPVVYHTTWDPSPLGDAIAAHPADPGEWSRALAADGFEYVLASASELERLVNRDRYFDHRVTTERLTAFLSGGVSGVTLVRVWPGSGHALYRIDGYGASQSMDAAVEIPDIARPREQGAPASPEVETR